MKFKVWCHDRDEWEKDLVLISQTGGQYHFSNLNILTPVKEDFHTVFPILNVKGLEIVVDSDIFEFNHYLYSEEILKGMLAFNKDELRYEINVFNNDYLTCVYYDPDKISNIKVIGNIQQNPELLPFEDTFTD